MQKEHQNIQDEPSDLTNELEHFQQENERVKAIIGWIGGVPKFRTKLSNTIFMVVIATSTVVSIIGAEKLRLLMIELQRLRCR